MTAKEMFEKLGFELHDNKEYINYVRLSKRIEWISFDKQNKTVDPSIMHSVSGTDVSLSKELSMEELKAIIQHCRELRWLDES